MFSRLIALVLSSAAVLLALTPTQAGPQPQRPPQRSKTTTPCAAKPDTLQRMFVPLAHLRHFDFGELVLNNNGVDAQLVHPTWFVRGSEPVRGRSLTVPPLTMEFQQIHELVPDGVPASRIDGLLIEYDGKLMELGGQVVLRDRSRRTGGSLDAHFSMAMDFQSARREATWTATREETATLVLANTGEHPIAVQIRSWNGARSVNVEPFQARLVRLDSSPTHQRTKERYHAMWVVLESNGGPADLRATGFVSTSGRGLRLIRFYDPSAVKQPHLYATRMRVANVSGDMALKNTSTLPVVARAVFLDVDSGEPLAEFAPLTLAPNAARTIDLKSAIVSLAAANDRPDAVGVRVESTGPAGALIGALYMHDITTGTSFDVPLRDSGAARSSTGSYPWRIDEDYETRVSITNVGSAPAQFIARVAYTGGELVFNPRELAVGASAAFDLRSLRDQQQKDGVGRALPMAADRGRFMWTVYGGGQSARLIGRAEVVSTGLGVSSSYSCGQCCPDSFVAGDISPFDISVGVSSNASYNVVEWRQNCYGGHYQVGPWATSWNVAVPSVASVYTQTYGVGRVTGESEGSTNVAAYWGVERWEPYIEDCLVDEWTNEQPAGATVFCAKPVNFRQTEGHPGPDGAVHFEYRWDSSTGNLADLTCRVGERVSYTGNWPFPSPPFRNSPENPTEQDVPGSDGVFSDIHSTSQPFLTPYSQVTVYGSQIYRHNCRCSIGDPQWITLFTPFPGLSRSFDPNGTGGWKFTTSKSGVSSVINPLPQ